jgi:rsbT co-antagonist protein RsbR
MAIPSLERARSTIAEAATARLIARAAGAFHRMGEQTCRKHVDAFLTALDDDLASAKLEAVRAAMQGLIEEPSVGGLSFADLRLFAQTLRSHTRDALAADPDAAELRTRVDDWFFELLLVGTMRFVLQREAQTQARAAKLEIQRLETQLEELEAALGEKTRLLEIIRQASTPIAPVVRGILVVPLVGTFDGFRAELLTEKLLHEVSRVRARAIILDITGVPVFDTAAAQLIIRLTRAVRMLGTEVILVGMSPVNARTIVELGVDLSGLTTFATLQDGLAQALMLQRLQIAPILE